MSALQPVVKEVIVGIREPKSVKIYPLSVAQQLKAKEVITTALEKMASVNSTADAVANTSGLSDDINDMIAPVLMGNVLLDTIEDSLSSFLEMSTNPDDNVTLDSVTNDQAVDIATIIYELNFESVIKKVQGLMERIKVATGQVKPAGPVNQSQSTE